MCCNKANIPGRFTLFCGLILLCLYAARVAAEPLPVVKNVSAEQGLPTSSQVVRLVYGGQFKPDQDFPKRNFWFRQAFSDHGVNKQVFFTKAEARGGVYPQGALISALVYRQKNGQWQQESVNREIGQVGVYGDAPNISRAQILPIGPDRMGFLFAVKDLHHGQGSRYVVVFDYFRGKFSDAGVIETGADNAGNCDRDIQTRDPVNGIEATPCWSFNGKITAKVTKGSHYPLVVKRRGDGGDQQGRDVEQYPKVRYVYCDGRYSAE